MDSSIVIEQLGREPMVPYEVAAWCDAGHPSVIRCYPLERRGDVLKPFPTLYWLTCPNVIAQIGRIEAQGWIGRFEAMMLEDESLTTAVSADHDRYIAERWALLSDADREAIKEAGLTQLYEGRGVAGVGDRARLKCLHAHFAVYLAARQNDQAGGAVGKWLAAEFGVEICSR